MLCYVLSFCSSFPITLCFKTLKVFQKSAGKNVTLMLLRGKTAAMGESQRRSVIREDVAGTKRELRVQLGVITQTVSCL